MLALLLALLMFFGILFGIVSFLGWAIHEHSTAKKYRQLQEMIDAGARLPKSRSVAQTGWKVTYKEGRLTKTLIVPCENESQALAEAMKIGVGPRSILSIERL